MYQTRILLVTPYFYPHQGESQTYAEELHFNLMKLDPTVKVDVLCYNTDKAPEIEEYHGFTIYRIPCIEILKGKLVIPNYSALWNTLTKLFAKNHYTFINSHSRFFESSWWVPFAARHFHTKAVLTDHYAHHPVHQSKIVSRVTKLVDLFLIPWTSSKYDLIITTNQETQHFLQQLGITNPQLVYGGVDTRFFTPRKRISKRRLPRMSKPLPQRAVLITFVGRMTPSMGPEILLRAAEQLNKDYSNLYFAFAGNGSSYPKLSKHATDRIFFLGTQDRADAARLLASSDIVVHPFLHHEGFSNILLEAAASGCAIVATHQGGTYEIIEDKYTGLLIQPSVRNIKRTLILLIEDKKLRKELAQNARRFVVHRYDWRKIVKAYRQLIERSIKHPLVIPTIPLTGVSVKKSLRG